jgi:hypothetical protein
MADEARRSFGGTTDKIYASAQHRQAAFFVLQLRQSIGRLPRPLSKAERLQVRQRIRDVENGSPLSLTVKNFDGPPGPFRKPRRMTGLLGEYATKGTKRAKAGEPVNEAVDAFRWQLQSIAKAVHRSAERTPWTKKERTDLRAVIRMAMNDELLSLTSGAI